MKTQNMNVIIDGTGHEEPITVQNKFDGVPSAGSTVIIDGEYYEVVHSIWDYDDNEVIIEVA